MSKVPVEKTETQKLIELNTKIFKVKKELPVLKKDSVNPFFKSSYADLNQHLSILEPILAKHKLVLLQPTVAAGAMGNVVKTEIVDIETAARVESSFIIPQTEDMQKLGGAITYARRYTLGALLGMQAEDDDGNTAVGKNNAPGGKKVKAVAGDF